ncbi:MAG: RusA family crossover junction endodeoxyribonuclease [Atopobiaceae bacterium]
MQPPCEPRGPEVTFSVPLVAHQGRPRIRNGARGAWLYEASDDERRKRVIAAEFRKEYRGPYPMLDGPARVEVLVFAPLPKKRPKRVVREPYTVKPDADNVAKQVLDALNGLAYADDAAVTELVVMKMPRSRGMEFETQVYVGPCDCAPGETLF